MKTGDTVYVIYRAQSVIKGELGEEITAQGFYTRWGAGHDVYFTDGIGHRNAQSYNDENIFETHEAARKEIFMRCLRYPRIRGAA